VLTPQALGATEAFPSRERVLEGNRHPGFADALRQLWGHREVVWAFTERHIRLKYRQAALGIGWAVLQPLAFLAIFAMIFGRMAALSGGRIPYPAFALSALVPWTFLQTAVTFGSQALIIDGVLVKKVYFAREAPVLGAIFGAGLDFAIGLGLLLVLMPFFGIQLSWTVLLVIPLWIVLALLAFGVALVFGALNVYYRDFRYLMTLLLQVWMFATPVAYPLTAVPLKWRTAYVLANPATGLIEGFRRTLAGGQAPEWGLVGLSVAGTALIAGGGYLLFKRLEDGFADAI
jgi:lipopolysaccharide transport system permease protein